jgi:hypothetical protein
MMNECDNCIYDINTILPEHLDLEKQCKWKEWKNENNRPILTEHSSSLRQVVATLNSQLRAFKTHFYVKKVQSSFFDSCNDSLKLSPNKAVMRIPAQRFF